MQSQKELNQIVESLQKQIEEDNDPEILKLVDNYLSLDNKDQQMQTIRLIQLIKTNKLQDSLVYYQQIAKQNIEDEDYKFCEVYLLYQDKKYEQALNKIQESKSNTKLRWKLIKSQILFKMRRFQESILIYQETKNQIDKADYGDYLINDLCFHLYVQDQHLNQKEQQVEQYLKQKDYLREVLFNYSILLSQNSQFNKSNEYLEKFQQMIQKEQTQESNEQNEEDVQTAQLLKDYNQFNSVGIDDSSIEQNLKNYQEILNNNDQFRNKIQLLNNIVVLRSLVKNETHFNDSVKKLEEFQNCKNILNDQQIKQVRLNKIAFLLLKNKVSESQKLIREFNNQYENDKQFNILKLIYLNKSKEFDAIKMDVNDDEILLIQAEIFRINGFDEKCMQQLKRLTNQNNAFVQGFMLSLMDKSSKLFDKEYIMKVVQQCNNVNLLRVCGDVLLNAKEYEAVMQVIDRLLSYNDDYVQYLIINVKRNINKNVSHLDEILNRMPKPDLIKDINHLLKLEQEYQMLTKKEKETTTNNEEEQTEIKKKIKKKRKGRVPKNYDPNVEVDPERWLPKYERKAFKKMKKKKNNRVTQGADVVNNESIGKIVQTSTANQEVSQNSQVNKKKNKKKRK